MGAMGAMGMMGVPGVPDEMGVPCGCGYFLGLGCLWYKDYRYLPIFDSWIVLRADTQRVEQH